MVGETDLQELLSSMSPVLGEHDYVFLTLENARYGSHPELGPIASFLESEGLTLVVRRVKALEYGFTFETVYKRITLEVHSSLDAVGLTAAFSEKLTMHGISANVIAGYFHDHIFINKDDAERAIDALNEFSR